MGKSPLAEEVGITQRGRWSYARVEYNRSSSRENMRDRGREREMANVPGRNSVCKVECTGTNPD